MPAAALESFIIPARASARKNITKKEMSPRVRNSTRARRKVRRTWLRRFRALASLTSLDTATGRPAVDTVSSTA